MRVFIAAATLGRGSVPQLPEEIRKFIIEHVYKSICSFGCRGCDRVLCFTRAASVSSYENVLAAERLCLDCYSATLT